MMTGRKNALGRGRFLGMVLGIILAAGNLSAWGFEEIQVRSFVDKAKLRDGDRFTLTIEITSKDSQIRFSPQPPDLSHFASFLGSSSSQGINVINGAMTAQKSMVLYYRAVRQGAFQIPQISIEFDGKTFQTDEIEIEVGKGEPSPGGGAAASQNRSSAGSEIQPESSLEGNLFLSAVPDRLSVYPNQAVTVTYKLYTRVEITNYAIVKLPDALGFWSEDLGISDQVKTYDEVKEGKKFLVGEIKKTAYFPTDSGQKSIQPMEIEVQARLRQGRSSRDLFDRFLEDDFFSSSLLGRSVQTRISSPPLSIEVKPFPEAGRPRDFTGAVGDFSLDVSLDKQEVGLHEAVSLKITITGKGNIKMLPEPNISFPPDLDKYDPKISLSFDRGSGVVKGSKTFEYVLIPRKGGEFRIPSVTYPYFDPVNEDYHMLESSPLFLNADVGTSDLSASPAQTRQAVQLVGRDIRFIKEFSPGFMRTGRHFHHSFWFAVFMLLPVLTLSGMGIYRRRLVKFQGDAAYARSRRAHQTARKRLKFARRLMRGEDRERFAAEISQTVLGFIADKLNLFSAGLMSDEVAERLREKGIEEGMIGEVSECIRQCDYLRFAPTQSGKKDWHRIYDQAESVIVGLEKARWN